MRKIGVRHLVGKRQKAHTLWYWQPPAALVRAGFLTRRLPNDLCEAIQAAQALNATLDAWRRGGVTPFGVTPLRPQRKDGLHSLNDLFQTDDGYRRLGPRSQSDYRYHIQAALTWAGEKPVRALTRKTVKEWYRAERDEHGAHTSRNSVAALRRLLSFGCDEGWIAANPCLRMRIAAGASRSRVWTLAERDTFCAAAVAAQRPSMALAVMLGWCIGQRPADLRALAWSAYDGRTIRLRQAKTGKEIGIPAPRELRAMLDVVETRGDVVVINEATGRPYHESAFQHLFAEIRTAAGLPHDLQFRDLRRTLATALGAAGATDDEIRSVTGHSTREVVAVYVRPDDTYAEAAMAKLERSRGGTESVSWKERGVAVRAKLEGSRSGENKLKEISHLECRVRGSNPRPSVYKTAALPLC